MLDTRKLGEELLEVLASVPPDTNPYLALAAQLRYLVLPKDDRHARNQLYALSAIFALITLLSLVSLWIRWRKGVLWFVRRSSTGLLRFHFSASWAVPGLVFLCLQQIAIEYERQLFRGKGRSSFMYWLTLPWLALAYSGLVATWAIMSSHVAQIQARGRCSTSRCSGIVNSAGIVLIVAYTLLLVPPAVVVGRLYAQLIDDLDAVVALLSELSRSWERGPPDLSSALPALQNIARVAIEYFRQLQIMFCVFAASSLLLAIIMAIASIFYLSLLRQEINSVRDSLASSQSIAVRSTASNLKLRRVWKTIFFTVTVNIVIAILLAVNSLMIAIEPEKLTHRKHLRIAILLPLFSVGAFGLLSAVMLLVRAIEAHPSNEKLVKAASRVVDLANERRGRRKMPLESEEATMVGSIVSLKEDARPKDASRRSSWFGRRGSSTPLQAKALVEVEIEVVIDEERTASSFSRTS
ncbi:hypothetical protein JCM3766R1_000744 [Sporobolomyces carnicolor]